MPQGEPLQLSIEADTLCSPESCESERLGKLNLLLAPLWGLDIEPDRKGKGLPTARGVDCTAADS